MAMERGARGADGVRQENPMKPPPILYQRAQEFRKRPTVSERRLWQALRKNSWGHKFRRQHPLGRFIVDFYHAAAGLIIELDGSAHADSQEHDEERTYLLTAAGYRVIRFSNDEIDGQLELALGRIYAACAAPLENERTS
jgi:very-short-patch-repair endonuclease